MEAHLVGARTATSRYTRLREALDQSMFNANWYEVDTAAIDATHQLTFADLFSGAGGLSVGFRAANYRKLFSIEINPFASATIRRNFPGSAHFECPVEDVTEADFHEALSGRPLDVLVGGPPCQGFSVAGNRRIDDPRNKLFLEFCRAVEICQPKFFVMENVPGILT